MNNKTPSRWASFWSAFLPATKADLQDVKEELMSELNDALLEIKGSLTEAKAEILEKIADLESQLANAQIPDDAKTTLSELKELGHQLADIVPGSPAPPPAPPAEPPTT